MRYSLTIFSVVLTTVLSTVTASPVAEAEAEAKRSADVTHTGQVSHRQMLNSLNLTGTNSSFRPLGSIRVLELVVK